MSPFYFDANASYGPTAASVEILGQIQDLGFNPNSIHSCGQRARAALEQARSDLRKFVGAGANDTILFNSGASEGNNAVISHFSGHRQGAIVSTAIEHISVLGPLERLRSLGAEVRIVPVHAGGELDEDALFQAVDASTALVTVMAANNETGSCLPLERIAQIVRQRARNAVIHSDIVQLLGKAPFSFRDVDLDIVTVSGHKFGALSGIGAVILREGLSLDPFVVGGPQEQKLRAGTENVIGILTFGRAAQECIRQGTSRFERMKVIRDRFEREMLAAFPDACINCVGNSRVANTSSIYIPGIRGDDVVVALDLDGICVSAGSACSSGSPKPSYVLQAMGQDIERIRSTLRVSFRADHDDAQLDAAFPKFIKCVERCRNQA